jgi:formate hydrogenlyase subunit 3/multisubunit Na+/H+ antiporter MnhD subunit
VTVPLIFLSVVLPLGAAALGFVPRCRWLVPHLVGWAALPALLLALRGEELAIDLPWLLLSARWGIVDATGRILLGVTAALWLAAGLFSQSYLAGDAGRLRFDRYFLTTMAGNLGAILSQDMPGFLFFYTLMSLVAYGLIVHDGKPESRFAGRVYITLVIVGEAFCLTASALAVSQTGAMNFTEFTEHVQRHADQFEGSPVMNLAAGLVLLGFGIKLGVMPLHIWLPLAHPVAPTPASAVLSGAMIKIGLLGMLRFLPLGSIPMPEWGATCVGAGIITAFLAALIGTTFSNPKTVLAYSSVSQMGMVAIAIGAGLLSPRAWEVVLPAILLFAAHHALCKGSLFLGVAVATSHVSSMSKRWLIFIGLAASGLSLAGLPLTSGFAAKSALKYVGETLPPQWDALKLLLPLTGTTTTLLILRFLWLVRPGGREPHGDLDLRMAIAWGGLTLIAVGAFAAGIAFATPLPVRVAVDRTALWAATWPMLLAAGVAAGVLLLRRSSLIRRLASVSVPTGDLVVPLTTLLTHVVNLWNGGVVRRLTQAGDALRRRWQRLSGLHYWSIVGRAALQLESDRAAGMLIVLLVTAMFVLLRV